MAKIFTFTSEPTPAAAMRYINRHRIKHDDLVTFQWVDNNHTLIGYWKNEPVSHATLPNIIREYYPDLVETDLEQSCYEQHYHYTVRGLGIVGGFDGRFYVMDTVTKGKKYLEDD